MNKEVGLVDKAMFYFPSFCVAIDSTLVRSAHRIGSSPQDYDWVDRFMHSQLKRVGPNRLRTYVHF